MTRDSSAYHLVPSALKAKGVSASEAAVVVKTALLGVPTIGYAFTRDELLAEPEGTDVLAMARRSYNGAAGATSCFSRRRISCPSVRLAQRTRRPTTTTHTCRSCFWEGRVKRRLSGSRGRGRHRADFCRAPRYSATAAGEGQEAAVRRGGGWRGLTALTFPGPRSLRRS